jgi:hypothetical protein
MILRLLHSEFPYYMRKILFSFFISVITLVGLTLLFLVGFNPIVSCRLNPTFVLILTLLFPVGLTLLFHKDFNPICLCPSPVPVHDRLLQERRVRVLHRQQRHLLLQQ